MPVQPHPTSRRTAAAPADASDLSGRASGRVAELATAELWRAAQPSPRGWRQRADGAAPAAWVGAGRPGARFNPAFLAPDELRRGFTVRRDTLARVVQALAAGEASQVLLTGPRGAGKTTLALRVGQELTVAAGGGWALAALGEETFTVTTAAELWAELAWAAEGTPEAAARAERAPTGGVPTEPGAGPRARLQAFAQAASRGPGRPGRVLAVIENLDTLLDTQLKGPEAARWQEEAAAAPWLAVLGTARRRPETLASGWQHTPLAPLTLSECRTLWAALSARLTGASQRLDGHAVRPIQLLTGGVPRRIVALAQASAPLAFHGDALWEALLALADAETPRVTAAAEALPPVERKVFAALAARWEPASARTVGLDTGLGTNRASALLHRLVGRGAVRRRGGRESRAGALYELADRGDNLVLALRRRGSAARRLRAVVDFAASFYWRAGGTGPQGEGLDPGEAAEAAEAAEVAEVAEIIRRAQEHGAAGRWGEAVDALGMLLDGHQPARALGGAALDVLLDASARGGEDAARALCEAPAWAHGLAPLRVALSLRAGVAEDQLSAAAEVRAVGLDVFSAILSRREA